MTNVTLRSSKDEIVGAAMEITDSQFETIQELRRQRVALIVVVTVLTTLLSL